MRLFLPRNWIVLNFLAGFQSIFNTELALFSSQFPKAIPIIDKVIHGNIGTKSTDIIFDDEKPIHQSKGLSNALLFSMIAVIIPTGINNNIMGVGNFRKNGKNRLVRAIWCRIPKNIKPLGMIKNVTKEVIPAQRNKTSKRCLLICGFLLF
jgi:hypothetical protein